ncbi:MAG: energy transducer TonB [Bacteroidia bacterium]|nr:energy transducer TonB [Bacteroidia bacterium]
MVQVPPEYPGGENSMYEFISKNVNYPVKEKENGISGRVAVRFAVMQDGSINNIEILTKTPEGFNNEVIRVIKLMPKWKPGMQDGRVVPVYFTLPVSFQLDDDTKPLKPKSRDMANVAGYIGIAVGVVVGVLLYKWLN